jgi:outer membrane protein assembly factor BamD
MVESFVYTRLMSLNLAGLRGLILVPLAFLMLLGACQSNNTQNRLAKLTPESLYDRGAKALRASDYSEAIRIFEALSARYPFTTQSRQARLDIMYAHYKMGEKESATDAAETFIRENPTHPRIDYAWYIKGLVEFERTPHAMERWLKVDLSERPPLTARDSFQAFRTVVEKFPKSAYAADSRKRMIYLRNRLADYELQVARYYTSRGAWVAAAQRAQQTIEQYDGAPAVKEALQILVRSYRELGYSELADNSEKVYKENFPEGESVAARQKKWWRVWGGG